MLKKGNLSTVIASEKGYSQDERARCIVRATRDVVANLSASLYVVGEARCS